MLTQARLKELLSYDAETGLFVWKKRGGKCVPGAVICGKDKDGYIRVQLDGKFYQVHRLAFLYMNGALPDGLVDHENLRKSDNRFSNLRVVNHSQNNQNKPLTSANKSGFKGVHWHAVAGKWKSAIKVNKKSIHLGLFVNKEDASAAYLRAAAIHHTHNLA